MNHCAHRHSSRRSLGVALGLALVFMLTTVGIASASNEPNLSLSRDSAKVTVVGKQFVASSPVAVTYRFGTTTKQAEYPVNRYGSFTGDATIPSGFLGTINVYAKGKHSRQASASLILSAASSTSSPSTLVPRSTTSIVTTPSTTTPPSAESGELLWVSDYDALPPGITIKPAWPHVQKPHNPGLSGPIREESITIVGRSDVPGSGRYKPSGNAMRVDLRPFDNGNGDVNTSGNTNRAEVYGRYPTTPASSTPAGQWPDPMGTTRWYSFSVYVPPDFATTDTADWFTFTQWKGFRGGSPPQALEIKRGDFRLGGKRSNRNLGSINKGEWTNFVIGFHWSTSETDGWVQVFKNGQEVVPREARATMDSYNGQPDPVYLKQGIYRPSFWNVTQALTFGPMKVGTTKESVQ